MKLLILLSVLFAQQAMSQEILRMRDGQNVSCKTKFDVFQSQRKTVYIMSDLKVYSTAEETELEYKISFLECNEVAGQFVMSVKESNPTVFTYFVPVTEKTVTVTDKKREMVAYDMNYNIVSKIDFTANTDGSITIKMKIKNTDLDVNNFELAQDKGSHYTNIALRKITHLKTQDVDLGSSQAFGGSYRVFFDL